MRRTGVAERLLEERRHRDGVLARSEPHRERGPGVGLDRRLVQRRVARCHRVHGDRRPGPGALVELVAGGRIGGRDPAAPELLGARRERRPAVPLRRGDGCDALREALGQVDHGGEHPVQIVDRVRGDAPVEARVKLARSRPQPHLRPCEAAQAGRDRRQVGVDHAAVEDDGGGEVALHVGGEVVQDRVAADLLLAVGEHPHVHPELARRREVERRAEERVEVPLVVACPAGVDMAVTHLGLERRARPEIQRPGRLDVVVAVDDDGRRAGPWTPRSCRPRRDCRAPR